MDTLHGNEVAGGASINEDGGGTVVVSSMNLDLGVVLEQVGGRVAGAFDPGYCSGKLQ